MLYTKDGYPEINEIVLCRVTKIYGNTTFVHIPEFEKDGVLTISEIAPGRIKNLKDYVVENKEIVCKVLRVDEKHNRIDVSLRRVNLNVRKKKLETIKKEDYADRVYTDISKLINITKDQLFEKTYEYIFDNYETVFESLYEIMLDNDKVNLFSNLNEDEKKSFVKVINDRIKPEEVEMKKSFNLKSFDSNGVLIIKEAIKNSLNFENSEKINIVYLAASKFAITIKHDDMKSADLLYKTFISNIEKYSKENNLIFEA